MCVRRDLDTKCEDIYCVVNTHAPIMANSDKLCSLICLDMDIDTVPE